ncbi:hypothetical protein BGZ60DRAFT_153670 [Tricladium varicosporioides]|nr:hypothetical protein BGZ60DRAFT_153670 [Hymenoscyphus varicosporioides]
MPSQFHDNELDLSDDYRYYPEDEIIADVSISQPSFGFYAADNWTTHFNASNASERDDISAGATTLCSTNSGNFKTRQAIRHWSLIRRAIPKSYTDLFLAVHLDLVEVIHILRLRGENISQFDLYGTTALHIAALGNHPRSARVLVEFNAPINFVIQRGADSTRVDEDGKQTMPLATERGRRL